MSVRRSAHQRAGETPSQRTAAPFEDEVHKRARRLSDDEIDEILAESFPASDPPPWTSGISRTTRS